MIEVVVAATEVVAVPEVDALPLALDVVVLEGALLDKVTPLGTGRPSYETN
jgi:hypothetical protein